MNGAITSRTHDPLAQTTSAPKGIPYVSTPCTTSSPGHRPLSCRRQGRGHLSAPGLLEKLALHVAKALRCTQCRLGSGTTQKTQKPPDANPGTRRPGRRVPAPDIAPQRHRWWRRRYQTGAYPARYRASALPTHHVTVFYTAITRRRNNLGQTHPVCLFPVVTGLLIQQKLSTLDVCCSSPEPAP